MGIFWGVVAGVSFGVFQIMNRQAGKGMGVFEATFLLLFASSVVLTIAAVLTEDLNILWAAPWQAWGYFIAAGFIHFFVGWTLLSVSQKRIGAARTGALVGAIPLFATIFAVIALQEWLTVPSLIGVLLVVAGVYTVSSS